MPCLYCFSSCNTCEQHCRCTRHNNPALQDVLVFVAKHNYKSHAGEKEVTFRHLDSVWCVNLQDSTLRFYTTLVAIHLYKWCYDKIMISCLHLHIQKQVTIILTIKTNFTKQWKHWLHIRQELHKWIRYTAQNLDDIKTQHFRWYSKQVYRHGQ